VARQYAARGARVCVVGRRESLVEEVAVDCRNAQKSARSHDVLAVPGDFTNVGDMVRVRDTLEKGVSFNWVYLNFS
jgi:NAD(P)-dependent dehydrogenase (short-subunit alcohol dehydrogenase family)